MATSHVQWTNLDQIAMDWRLGARQVLTVRRIGGRYSTLFYAGRTPMDLITALSGLRAAIDFGKVAVATRDENKIAEAEQRFTRVLLDVQNVCLDLQQKLTMSAEAERSAKDRIHELESTIRDLERKAAERARYKLVEPYAGTFVLELKDSIAAEEPVHRLCQGCMDNLGKKVVLQGGPSIIHCPECKQAYRIARTPPINYDRN